MFCLLRGLHLHPLTLVKHLGEAFKDGESQEIILKITAKMSSVPSPSVTQTLPLGLSFLLSHVPGPNTQQVCFCSISREAGLGQWT